MKIAFAAFLLGFIFPSFAQKRVGGPSPAPDIAAQRFVYWVPLLGYIAPTAGIGYGLAIPRSCIAGVNSLTLGFAATVLTAALAYGVCLSRYLGDVRVAEATAKAIPQDAGASPVPLRVRHLGAAAVFAAANLGIGLGWVLPGSCAWGVNEITIGFGLAIVTGVLTCVFGPLQVRQAIRQRRDDAFLAAHPAYRAIAVRPFHLLPAAIYALAALTIGYGFVIPGSCIAGLNDLSVGYAVAVVTAALASWAGVFGALRDVEERHRQAWLLLPAGPVRFSMRARYWAPMLVYLALTLGTGFGVAIPGSCMAGVNSLSLGFLAAVGFAALTYRLGLSLVLYQANGDHAHD